MSPAALRPGPAARTLTAIKLAHTAAWALFAGCIVAIPIAAALGALTLAAILILVVTVEVLILAANRCRCPLTNVAARYTDDRRDNFDIYLPRWLARHNKLLFGTLFVAGVAFTAWCWWRSGAG
jgi:hypothetical protein